MVDLPRLALSIRQPWAWAIIHAGKDIENRSWSRSSPALAFRGEICIHAAQGMTRSEYDDAADTIERLGGVCPSPAELLRGGIIGRARVRDIVKRSSSPWFFGPWGLVLDEVEPVEFVPCSGQLGFFHWKEGGAAVEPAKWMRDWPGQAASPLQADMLGEL